MKIKVISLILLLICITGNTLDIEELINQQRVPFEQGFYFLILHKNEDEITEYELKPDKFIYLTRFFIEDNRYFSRQYKFDLSEEQMYHREEVFEYFKGSDNSFTDVHNGRTCFHIFDGNIYASTILSEEIFILKKIEVEIIEDLIQKYAVKTQQKDISSYNDIVDKILAYNFKEVDFGELRIAYSNSELYSPYVSEELENIRKSYKEERYEEVIELAKNSIKKLMADLDFHFYVKRAYQALGEDTLFQFHNYIYYQLLYSILESGDGLSKSTAYRIISISEEYHVLGYLKIKQKLQNLITDEGHYYDVFTLEDSDQKEIYFNIDIPHNYLHNYLLKHLGG